MTSSRHGKIQAPTGRSVLAGAFSLLDELRRAGEAGLTRLATGTGLPKATAHRLLGQLVAVGAVQRRAGRYRIGSRLFRLGTSWDAETAIWAASQHPLRRLAEWIPAATVCVAVSDNGRTIILDTISGAAADVPAVKPGTSCPPGSAVDRILATDLPDGYTSREWARLVHEARVHGLAIDHNQPISCVAVPVPAPGGLTAAAIAALVLDSQQVSAMAPAVRRAADMVRTNLAQAPTAEPGWSSWLDLA